MATSFKEFLREQAAKEENAAQRAKAEVDEWRTAIEQLFNQIRGWLAESDPDGIIQIEQTDHEVREPDLGRYRVPRLNLEAFGKWVGIIPKARHTIGTARPPRKSVPERATGRVDMTDELRRYILYRFPGEGRADDWMIDDLQGDPKPLTQENFEKALMSYLR